jgi:bifunctional DNA-binding transcriptional regulator/antitoxin component of YhaV-PrlF toxin-antitoxin module
MSRCLIRKRWQITIPRDVRQHLNLFVGQTLNFYLDEEYCLKVVPSGFPKRDEDAAAFRDLLRRKPSGVEPRKKRRKFRISDKDRVSQLELQEIAPVVFARNQLRGLLSEISTYLLKVQDQLDQQARKGE